MQQYYSKLHGSDRVDIISPSYSSSPIIYVDYYYETFLDIRRKKIEKIKNIINKDV